ncbi:similar to UVB-resistance protein UVR8 [Cyanidioschyzon merolae strain 10D]|jgi:alpha-tubulin suppressor-like RCC1 family protein|uniref:Similar to UVB-resistance protein UVR8 n=1 Tax=Cyanidioschyzon merolae (strain NIES-3377 / 10D) TaxID=280699 RepID=M1V7F3_CYAM1|nr:similar to UVB-resistance protein UVR8 [Cyanidioschyzon merolae strain 10D]BAM79724.1 similar to UVB-resistance protein UVR8 [Cyanidioschyzon merolae strain 10D]|eukprot:XP_005536010.1 similar to UVB-resistance protein UVR8 [Cyanidioschyzon merolae strain 10D]
MRREGLERGTEEGSELQPALVVWGRAKNHRLGIPYAEGDIFQPSELPKIVLDRLVSDRRTPNHVLQVACGGSHTAILLRNGALYTVGHGLYGQLGLGQRIRRVSLPTRVRGVLGPEAITNVGRSSAVALPPIEAVACGRYHTFAVSSDGRLFSWGGGKNGRLGTGTELRSFLPWPVSTVQEKVPGQPGNVRRSLAIPSECQIVAVECGYHHSVALSAIGVVYTCGWGAYGQLGHGSCNDEPSLLAVTFRDEHGNALPNLRIIKVASGDRHTLVLTDDGRIYGFGSNEYGQLGITMSCDQETAENPTSKQCVFSEPRLLTGGALAGRRIAQIACGERHSVALSDQGEVICWGHGMSGQLGLGESITMTPTPQILNTRNSPLASRRVTGIACGHENTLFLVSDNEIYVTGSGEYGLLGIGAGAPRMAFEPVRVQLPPGFRVDRATMGHFHAAAWGYRSH